ncbi:DUF2786 domain-containing protein [Sporosarcina sp. FSL W7-1283]|uniref:DUF2786 domain-containing protein n=1 Tax=Sporosarcina sp. FSL W7-1283 TaxID=2921560 RepID=UPI0030F8B106
MGDRNENIIKKIKGLLAIANDNKNDEESQTAFIMAQKLMVKYDISSGEVEERQESDSILEGKVTVHKTLYWWERKLAQIITKNFKVTFFYNSKILKGESKKKRAIIFLGFENDVALAKEMYFLAYDVLTFYANDFVKNHYAETEECRSRGYTMDLKNSYMRGFLDGINEKFEIQVKEMKQEYGLMVLVPTEVQQAYDDMFEGKKRLSFKVPRIEELAAYHQGHEDGVSVDYTKSTLDEGAIF